MADLSKRQFVSRRKARRRQGHRHPDPDEAEYGLRVIRASDTEVQNVAPAARRDAREPLTARTGTGTRYATAIAIAVSPGATT